jgi:hypothetical protein
MPTQDSTKVRQAEPKSKAEQETETARRGYGANAPDAQANDAEAKATEKEAASEAKATQEAAKATQEAAKARKDHGSITKLPKTPQEIAAEGTKVALSGSLDAGGNLPPNDQSDAEKPLRRVWALDTDVNTNRRNDADPLQGDFVTSDPELAAPKGVGR